MLIHYIGVLQDDGTRFASNWDGELYPVTLGAGDVIPGWEQGLVGVRAGKSSNSMYPPSSPTVGRPR